MSFEVNQEKVDNEYPKKKAYAILGDSVPLIMMGGGILSCAMCQSDNLDNHDNRENCLMIFFPTITIVSSLGTIPSHFYANSATWKKFVYPSAKFIIGALSSFWYYFGSGLAAISESRARSDDVEDIGAMWMKEFIPIWSAVIVGIHIIEMVDQSKSIIKYNAELDEKQGNLQVFLTPTVWDDRVGMAFHVNF